MCVAIQIKSGRGGGEGEHFTHNKISKFEHLAYPVCKFNEE